MKTRILFGTSPKAFENKGGGEILLTKSRQYIKELGFETALFDGEQNFKSFDLFHNFSLHRDCLEQVTKAKEAGLKIVVSPVYWPSIKHALLSGRPIKGRAKSMAAEMLNRFGSAGVSAVKNMLALADIITPSSIAEATMLKKRFGIEGNRIKIIHNGVETRFSKASPEKFEKKYGLKDFVLYVGRIEERKNVFTLIKAMKGIDEVLVIIGNAKKGSEAYYKKCKKAAGKKIVFLSGLKHEDKMLESAYAACKVFVLPSWYETPGLAGLEAGLAGANVVITKEGCTKEYFGRFALYVNPVSVSDIRERIKEALDEPKSNMLKNHIKDRFFWENSAKETKQAYETLLGDK